MDLATATTAAATTATPCDTFNNGEMHKSSRVKGRAGAGAVVLLSALSPLDFHNSSSRNC